MFRSVSKLSLPLILFIMTVSVSGPASLAQPPGPAATPPGIVVVGLPAVVSPQCAASAREVLTMLVTKLPPGTRVLVFNAKGRERLAEFTIPASTPNGRLRTVNRDLAKIAPHLDKRGAVREGIAPDDLDAPGFAATIGSLVKTAGGASLHVLLIGSPYRADRDEGAAFAKGQVPSADHVLVDSKRSPFGTADVANTLAGCTVHWLLTHDDSSARERAFLSAFWSFYFDRNLHAVLSTFLDSAPDVVERVVAGASDPLPCELPKPVGKLTILTIDALPKTVAPAATQPEAAQMPDAPSAAPVAAPSAEAVSAAAPFEKPVDTAKSIAVGVDLVLVVDGSASQEATLALAPKLAREVGQLGADLSKSFTLSVIVHRGVGRMTVFGPGVMQKSNPDGSPTAGMTKLNSFILNPTAGVQTTALSERAAAKLQSLITGSTSSGAFAPVSGNINIETAINAALEVLSKSQNTRKVFLVVGDAAGSESDQAPGLSASDSEAEARAIAATEGFVAGHPDTRIITIFSGPSHESRDFTEDHAEAIEFFERLARTAGERGKFQEGLDGLAEYLRQGVLNP
ncbi:MAG TPA: hypothetical protein VF669_17885 [Tepidisphaeraceae bacterium]|jgi:hypothetical protein